MSFLLNIIYARFFRVVSLIVGLIIIALTCVYASDVHAQTRVQVQADLDACQVQTHLPWCPHAAPQTVPAPAITREFVFKIEAQVRKNFTFRDKEIDTWGSEDVSKRFYGNCDTLTFSELQEFAKLGVPADRLYRLIVVAPHATMLSAADASMSKTDKHMIGAIRLDSGEIWVVADARQGKDEPYRLADLELPTFLSNHVSDGLIWHHAEIAAN